MDEFLRRRAVFGKSARWRPMITLTDLLSPRNTAPVRRLTVNRKPLSTASRLHFPQNSQSLAQPPMARNGLYFPRGISLRSIDFRVTAALYAKNFESCYA
jgi:hypothetical protein